MTFYFKKIKDENKRLLPMQAHYMGQLNYLQKEYHTLVKDNESERQKYVAKLTEYAEMLEVY